ncbi:MAG: galactokinase family protein [Kiritimatiellae bacterium]|jgi:L-arabinokinase|nr:galactokinase family protein [Kiritimatiellia bacterium]
MNSSGWSKIELPACILSKPLAPRYGGEQRVMKSSPNQSRSESPRVACAEWTAFEKRLTCPAGTPEGLSDYFAKRPLWVARAPARLDVMGGIADYSGAHVCEATLGPGIVVAVQPCRERVLRIRSVALDPASFPVEARLPLSQLECRGRPISYAAARAIFRDNPLAAWSAYVAGSLLTLQHEQAVHLQRGWRILLLSAVPMNVGLASSAAVEIATLCAFNAAFGLGLDATRIAQLGQMVENRVVGAPCGIMDQIAIASGQRGKLLHLLCRPGSVEGTIAIPRGTGFVGINSLVRHSVAAAPYGDVRIGTFMGRRILNAWRTRQGAPPLTYLTELTGAELAACERILPETLSGQEFLARYRDHGDSATTIRPASVYRIRGPVRHAVLENERVLRFMAALQATGPDAPDGWRRAGEELAAAHASYRDECRLSVPEVDALVEAVGCYGAKKGLFGAKITGGGAGGTVAIFGRVDALKKYVPQLVRDHAQRMGRTPDVFWGTSPGAFEGGARRYIRRAGGWVCQRV